MVLAYQKTDLERPNLGRGQTWRGSSTVIDTAMVQVQGLVDVGQRSSIPFPDPTIISSHPFISLSEHI
jgi:hypothetical protein